MNVYHTITLARKHVGNGAAMESSARFCLSDAITALDAGAFDNAKERAIKSLAYSVGIYHADYKRAIAGSDVARYDGKSALLLQSITRNMPIVQF